MIKNSIPEYEFTDETKRPIEVRFDNFDDKAIKTLNQILEESNAEIVVSSDWKKYATLEEMGQYYEISGISKKPIAMTEFFTDLDKKDRIPIKFPWDYTNRLEQERYFEITCWLEDNPEVSQWVAIDDLHLGNKVKNSSYGSYTREWGLTNFIWTPQSDQGIKQSGIKEKILKFLS